VVDKKRGIIIYRDGKFNYGGKETLETKVKERRTNFSSLNFAVSYF